MNKSYLIVPITSLRVSMTSARVGMMKQSILYTCRLSIVPMWGDIHIYIYISMLLFFSKAFPLPSLPSPIFFFYSFIFLVSIYPVIIVSISLKYPILSIYIVEYSREWYGTIEGGFERLGARTTFLVCEKI